MVSAESIKKIAVEVGFSCCGIARCRTLDEHKIFFDHWLKSDFHSGLGYMTKYQNIRFDPTALLDGAKTVIVCAVNYKNNTIFDYSDSSDPKIASYALTTDYHTTIKQMLAKMVVALKEQVMTLRARTFTDTAPLLEKAWAVEAGLGWIGRNSLLITPDYGSLVLLGEIVIDSEADAYDTPYSDNHCGECRLCMEACPNGAIVAPKVIDTGRCIARLTIEREAASTNTSTNILTNTSTNMPVNITAPDVDHATNISADPTTAVVAAAAVNVSVVAPTLAGWVFGCDICQRVCPHNRRSPETLSIGFRPIVDRALLTRAFWLSLDVEQFKTIFGTTPISRTGLEQIQKRVIA